MPFLKMDLKRILLIIYSTGLLLCIQGIFLPSNSEFSAVKKAPRWNMPWMGVGLWCNGCPPLGCEDDEAIIHGYCCGCAYTLDKLPVRCPDFLQCPLNLHGLCHDYEYMMRCCC